MKLPKKLIIVSAIGTAVGAYVLFKDSTGGAKYSGDERIAGRTVVITGANTGVGRTTAQELAKRGGRIVMACRDMAKCERVRQEIIDSTFNKNIHCRKLDLASFKSIQEFAELTNKTEKRIDILINNAGVMHKDRTATEDGIEIHLGVNYFGHFLLTNLLLDKIIASAPSRIINMACVGHHNSRIAYEDLNSEKNWNPQLAYRQSKLAVIMFTVELAKRLQGTNVTVNAVNPGVVNTDIRRHFGSNLSSISKYLLYPIWVTIYKTPVQGSQTVLYSALDPSLADKTGQLFTECRNDSIDEKAQHEEQLKRLWAVSDRWTRLQEYKTPTKTVAVSN